MTKTLEPLQSLPPAIKSIVLAFSVVFERIGSLPKADRDDLFDLVQALRDATDPAESQTIMSAMEEILIGPPPVATRAMELPEEIDDGGQLQKWTACVGDRIKALRGEQALTQSDLAERAGLTQSHVSRIENGTLSATHKTLSKIAGALGVPIGEFDPSSE